MRYSVFAHNSSIIDDVFQAKQRSSGKIIERQPSAPPNSIIQAEGQATNDLTAISGINEALIGVDIPGRAIELKQKQAITHVAPMFDNLRKSKKQITFLLWGKRGKPGVIPQNYTTDKVYRIEGENGQQFIRVNQRIAEQDPLGNEIYRTLTLIRKKSPVSIGGEMNCGFF